MWTQIVLVWQCSHQFIYILIGWVHLKWLRIRWGVFAQSCFHRSSTGCCSASSCRSRRRRRWRAQECPAKVQDGGRTFETSVREEGVGETQSTPSHPRAVDGWGEAEGRIKDAAWAVWVWQGPVRTHACIYRALDAWFDITCNNSKGVLIISFGVEFRYSALFSVDGNTVARPNLYIYITRSWLDSWLRCSLWLFAGSLHPQGDEDDWAAQGGYPRSPQRVVHSWTNEDWVEVDNEPFLHYRIKGSGETTT